MSSTGTRTSKEIPSIPKLKQDIEVQIATLKSSRAWTRFEKLLRALNAAEHSAGLAMTSAQDLLDLTTNATSTSEIASVPVSPAGQGSELILGEKQEPETVAEIERGS